MEVTWRNGYESFKLNGLSCMKCASQVSVMSTSMESQ